MTMIRFVPTDADTRLASVEETNSRDPGTKAVRLTGACTHYVSMDAEVDSPRCDQHDWIEQEELAFVRACRPRLNRQLKLDEP